MALLVASRYVLPGCLIGESGFKAQAGRIIVSSYSSVCCCMSGRSSVLLTALFTCTAKFDPGAHGARCAWAMAVHHAVGISRQRNSGYRPSRVNIMAQGISTPDPSLSPTHLSIMRGRATTTHYTHHRVSLMVSHNTTLVPSLGLHITPACKAGLSAGMQRERLTPNKKEKTW